MYEDKLKEPLLREKFGDDLAKSILKLREFYRELVVEYRNYGRLNNREDVHELCNHIHGVWVGMNLDRYEKADYFVCYKDLKNSTQFYDFKELCMAWKSVYGTVSYPVCFNEYANRQNWDMKEIGDWKI